MNRANRIFSFSQKILLILGFALVWACDDSSPSEPLPPKDHLMFKINDVEVRAVTHTAFIGSDHFRISGQLEDGSRIFIFSRGEESEFRSRLINTLGQYDIVGEDELLDRSAMGDYAFTAKFSSTEGAFEAVSGSGLVILNEISDERVSGAFYFDADTDDESGYIRIHSGGFSLEVK